MLYYCMDILLFIIIDYRTSYCFFVLTICSNKDPVRSTARLWKPFICRASTQPWSSLKRWMPSWQTWTWSILRLFRQQSKPFSRFAQWAWNRLFQGTGETHWALRRSWSSWIAAVTCPSMKKPWKLPPLSDQWSLTACWSAFCLWILRCPWRWESTKTVVGCCNGTIYNMKCEMIDDRCIFMIAQNGNVLLPHLTYNNQYHYIHTVSYTHLTLPTKRIV